MSKTYKARSGQMQFKPSLSEVEEMSADNQGFCLACGAVQEGVEPDACKHECDECGALKVYGAEELALMGLAYDDDEE